MPIVNSRQTLKEYCLRKLGSPVIQINVDDDQVEDRIDDALGMFFQYHSDGLVKQYLAIQLTDTDIASKKIPVPENVYSVTKIFPINSVSRNYNNISYVSAITDIIDSLRSGSSVLGAFRYFLVEQHLSLLNLLFNGENIIRFNRFQGFLNIDTDWSTLAVGDFILLEVYTSIDMDEYERTWGDWWLESYATALIKQQWGMNMKKYQGFQLPSGIVLDGQTIYNEAIQEITDLEQKLQDTYQLPIDFYMG